MGFQQKENKNEKQLLVIKMIRKNQSPLFIEDEENKNKIFSFSKLDNVKNRKK